MLSSLWRVVRTIPDAVARNKQIQQLKILWQITFSMSGHACVSHLHPQPPEQSEYGGQSMHYDREKWKTKL